MNACGEVESDLSDWVFWQSLLERTEQANTIQQTKAQEIKMSTPGSDCCHAQSCV